MTQPSFRSISPVSELSWKVLRSGRGEAGRLWEKMRETMRCLGKDKEDLSKYLDAGVERGVWSVGEPSDIFYAQISEQELLGKSITWGYGV